MKRGLVIAFFALFLIASVSAATIDSRLNNLEEGQKVQVIVSLDSQQKDLGVSEFTNRMSVAEELEKKYNVTYVGKTVNAISMEVTKEQLAELQARSDIISIKKDPELHIALHNSTNIINATLTWNLQTQGINLTGAGQTICILDTGVNYTHPDLDGCNTSTFLAGNCSKVIGGYDFVNTDADPYDDNGHGTHVAGIAAANGTIKGIAPDAKIVMLKVCNSGGDCQFLRVIDAINWCVSNSSIYNISIISISIADTSNFTTQSECDNYDNGLSGNASVPLANAVAKNISVVISAGNWGNNTGVSYPACLSNATAVGSSNKDDSISSFSNRASFMSLLAPGLNINSTSINGNYELKWGTSMATPHVAGAIAILKQLLSLEGLTRTPKQLEAVLNSTGKIINDTTGVNYTRINVYTAALSLDTIVPNISLISPSDNLVTVNSSLTFSANVTDWQLANITFTLMNSSGIFNQTTFNITGTFNQTNITIYDLQNGNYNWTFLVSDNNSNTASLTRNLVINISFSLNSPANLSYTNNAATFTCSAQSDVELANVTFMLKNATNSGVNQTYNLTGQTNSSTFAYTFSASKCNNNCTWHCVFGLANGSSVSSSESRMLFVDKILPAVTLVSPDDGDSIDSTDDRADVDFEFDVSDNLKVDSCTLTINDGDYEYDYDINNKTYTKTVTKRLYAEYYWWSVTCTDMAGNTNTSSERDFTINEDTSGDGGSGGSSGSNDEEETTPNTTYSPTVADVEDGYTKVLRKNQTVGFALPTHPNIDHILRINLITEIYVNMSIESNPIYLVLGKGQSKKLNMTNNSVYDVFVKVNDITSNTTVNITLQAIKEPIPGMIPNVTTNASSTSNESTNSTSSAFYQSFKKNLKTWIIFWTAAIVLIAGIILFFVRRHLKEAKKNEKDS
jgi:subtilisin family serine protease